MDLSIISDENSSIVCGEEEENKAMWSPVVYQQKKDTEGEQIPPCTRWKHSVTLLGEYLYLLAGRNGNLPLKDFWRYHMGTSVWESLNSKGDAPPSLQDHTAVPYKESIYVFGGELSFSAGTETPLWIYNTVSNSWKKVRGQRGAHAPKGRRGHSALVHRGSILLYGGYCDLKGSSNELWVFHFETESWHLLANNRNDPPGRHKHSAVLYDGNMWIYGGMTDLQERGDMWKLNTGNKKWYPVKCKFNPGVLHGHAACKVLSSMIMYGGERNGHPVNELWRFHFGTETWERIYADAFCPRPLSECHAVTVPEMLLADKYTNFDITGEGGNENSPPRHDASSMEWTKQCQTAHSRNIFEERSNFTTQRTKLQGVMAPPRRQAMTPNSGNLNILREISKLSQMNLSLLGGQNKRCSYHTLRSNSNESINNLEDSTGYSTMSVSPSVKSPTPTISKSILRDVSSCNTVLTPVEATKLVYLDDEEAPVTCGNGTPSDTHRMYIPSSSRNRRSYPSNSSVRFANLLVTPEESSDITSDYASCENIHRLPSIVKLQEKSKTPLSEYPISFSNPNYINSQRNKEARHNDIQERISRGDYVKLLEPLEDTKTNKNAGEYEMVEMRPVPPKSLPLLKTNTGVATEKQKKYRACSAGRYDSEAATNFCVFLIGGKEDSQTTTFKQPISMWKLNVIKHLH